MPQIIDILGGIAGQFTVDNALTEVPIVGTPGFLADAINGFQELQPNDNINILSFTISYPWCFCSGSTPPWVTFNGRETPAGAIFQIVQVGSGSTAFCPCENVDIPLGVYVPWTTAPTPGPWGLYCSIGGTVSMVNVPAAFPNGTTIDIHLFARIEHNIALTV